MGKSFLSGLKIFFSAMEMYDWMEAGSFWLPNTGGFSIFAPGFLAVSFPGMTSAESVQAS
ncbi:MAG: hypothetical protein A2V90_05740 [Gammaproteobacteria bacterium RBG_16_57_12]|nr:MAG: hypothetical protein A2V90_05740 [Gammaproteobacteria bacterium RBG_16_57_12]